MRRTAVLFSLLGLLTLTTQAEVRWIGTWAAASAPYPMQEPKPTDIGIGQTDLTLRQVVHISQGGETTRIALTNEFGTTPLTISAAHLAFLSANDAILPATDHALTFSGQASVTIPPGAFISSDPLKVKLPIFSDIVISLHIPAQPIPVLTMHSFADQTNYVATGDQTSAANLTDPTKVTSWYLLKDVEVNGGRKSAAVVTLGDSITDGAASTIDTNRRWPDVLATRLATWKKTKHLSVLNEGIGGNRVLHNGWGPRALDRFDRDALNQPRVKYIVILEGINDIGRATKPQQPDDAITAQQLIDAFQQLVTRAHARNIKVIGATITPFEGAGYYGAEGETIRQTVNQWIRTSKTFDGVIDFDKAAQDPATPSRFLPKHDSGDHLHPSDQGHAAMGAAIDLKLFK